MIESSFILIGHHRHDEQRERREKESTSSKPHHTTVIHNNHKYQPIGLVVEYRSMVQHIVRDSGSAGS